MTFTPLRTAFGLGAGCALVVALATGCAEADGTAAGPVSPTGNTPAPSAPATPSATPSPVDDGCPPDVNLMFEWLKDTPAIVDKIDKSMTGIEEPTCYQGWAMARTVMTAADASYVLFKMAPDTGKWNAVAVGTDSVCDGDVKVPADVQAKLGPAC